METLVYKGPGWKMWVPVIACPESPLQAIQGPQRITGFTEFAITQVINHGDCAVANRYAGNVWDSLCPTPNGTADRRDVVQSRREVFGYYTCNVVQSAPTPEPGPRSALGTRLRLVR